jgi:HKD family nuclease
MRVEVISQFALGAVTLKRVGDSLNHAIVALGCERFRFAVAYMRLSGLDRLGAAIDTLINRGGTVSDAIGVDNGVTSEEALRSLRQVSTDSTVFHSISGFIFHPKLYIASGPNRAVVVVGSPNLTRDGLYRNVEIATAIHLDLRSMTDLQSYKQYDAVMAELLDTSHPNVQPLTDVLINILVSAGKVKTEAQSPEPGPVVVSKRGRGPQVPANLSTLFPAIRVPVAPPPLRQIPSATPVIPVPPAQLVGTSGTFLLPLSPFDSSHRTGIPGTPEVRIPHGAVPFFPPLAQDVRKYPDVFFDVVLNTPTGRAIHSYRLWYYEYRATGTRIDEYRLRMDRETIDLSTPTGGDLLIINKVVVSGATAYEVTVLPQTDPTFSTFLARCTRIVQGKRWGLI